jgi:hypothetical protein
MQPVPTLPLIPTRYKQKVFHTHSWPIGGEAISRALVGVPQFPLLELNFAATWAFQLGATSYSVLQAKYLKRDSFLSTSNERIERGDMDAKWSIHICPVPRGQRHEIHAQLLERGLPFVKKWMTENTLDGRPGRSTLTLSYNEETKVLGHEIERTLQPERV